MSFSRLPDAAGKVKLRSAARSLPSSGPVTRRPCSLASSEPGISVCPCDVCDDCRVNAPHVKGFPMPVGCYYSQKLSDLPTTGGRNLKLSPLQRKLPGLAASAIKKWSQESFSPSEPRSQGSIYFREIYITFGVTHSDSDPPGYLHLGVS